MQESRSDSIGDYTSVVIDSTYDLQMAIYAIIYICYYNTYIDYWFHKDI